MKRMVMKSVEEWYERSREKVLFIRGATGVGKTWLIREFCRERDTEYIYLSVPSLSYMSTDYIKKSATLIVFDDINSLSDMEKAADILSEIKADERLRGYDVIMAGQIADDKMYDYVFPNKDIVEYLEMYPMNFSEFYTAVSPKYKFGKFDILKMYMITGGMPDVVKIFLEDGNLTKVRACQRVLMEKMFRSFNDGGGCKTSKEEEILWSVSEQMSGKSTGFTFRQVNKNARAREYENAIDNLLLHGIIYRIYRFAPKSDHGIANYKLMIFDIGLWGMLAGMSETAVFEEREIFDREHVAAFLTQELISYGTKSYYVRYWYKPRAKARLSVVLEMGDKIMPVELMACAGKKSKSMESFMDMYRVFQVIRVMKPERRACIFDGQKQGVYFKACNESSFELWEAGLEVSGILNRLKEL